LRVDDLHMSGTKLSRSSVRRISSVTGRFGF
jgi:hypothetical protein